MNLAGVALALGAALCWGISDLGGGIASRRSTPLATLVVSQSAAIVLALAVVAISNERYPGLGPLSWAIVSGVAGFIALTCFYRALATGAMGLAAAVTGVIGAGIPVVAGIVGGDRLEPLDLIGIALALLAVILVTRPAQDAGMGRSGLALSITAGTAAGLFFLTIGHSVAEGGGTWWSLAASRGTLLLLAVVATIVTRRTRSTIASASPLMAGIGLADLSGTALFVLSSSHGALSVAAVVSSQYPAVTAVLARVVIGERLARTHAVGVGVALVAIALIAWP